VSHSSVSARYSIVPGDPHADRQEVLDLATRNRPGPRSRLEAKYVKYYENNPQGAPSLFFARDNESGSLVGMTALFPTTLWIAGERVPAGIGGDFAVDEGHRGFGPAVALQRATVTAVSQRGLKCVYGSPNQNSELVVARAGYVDAGRLTRFIKLLSARPLVDRYVRRPRLASVAVGVARPFVSILSRERLHRRSRRFSVEEPELFDDRFAGLWNLTRRQLGATSERNAELLNWRYEKTGPSAAPGNYSILAVLDGDEVAGYAVYRARDESHIVYDVLCRPEKSALDALLSELIRDARRKKAAAIDLGYAGRPNLLTERLRAFGFLQRTAENGLLVYVDGEAPSGVDLGTAESWYFTSGDTDF
jgi:GNAT superfamily N-acetyltransferase